MINLAICNYFLLGLGLGRSYYGNRDYNKENKRHETLHKNKKEYDARTNHFKERYGKEFVKTSRPGGKRDKDFSHEKYDRFHGKRNFNEHYMNHPNSFYRQTLPNMQPVMHNIKSNFHKFR